MLFIAGVIFGSVTVFGLACIIVGHADREEYDPPLPPADGADDAGDTERSAGDGPDFAERNLQRFACYIAGNDAYDTDSVPDCPFPEGSVEALQWVAGWCLAERGILVEGRDERNALRTAARESVVATRH
jgi:hypothetical protein